MQLVQFFIFSFFISFIISSSHLFFGLPSGRVNIGFHLYTLFTILSSGIRCKWPQLHSLNVLALSTYNFHLLRSWMQLVQFFIFSFFISFIISSSHLFFGLPSGRVNIGFYLYTLFTILSSGIRCKWTNQLNLWAFKWFIIFLCLISSSNSSFVLILHVPSLSFVGPKILLNNFLSNTINLFVMVSFQTPRFTCVCSIFILHLNVARKRVVVSSGAQWDQNNPLNATLLPINRSIISCQLIHLLVTAKNTDEVKLIPNSDAEWCAIKVTKSCRKLETANLITIWL